MTSFKNWLQKNKFGLNDFAQGQVPDWLEDKMTLEEFEKQNPDFILTSTLGEWAIDSFINEWGKFWQRGCKKDGFKETLAGYRGNPLIEIAIACLGKQAVQKRLEELDKK